MVRSQWWCGIVCCLALAASAGCGRQSQLAYTSREQLKELPQKHQQEITDFLLKYYGTPLNPRHMVPATASAASDEAKDAKDAGLTDKTERTKLRLGAAVYARQCAGCHGTTGDGKGPAAAYLDPPPRDYRLGRFKFTSTPRGVKPRHEDLVRIIRRGAKGTSMPGFRWMPEEELEAVIDYVVMLASRGEMELGLIRDSIEELEEDQSFTAELVAERATRIANSWNDATAQMVIPITAQPARNDESVRLGAKAFVELNCFKCHGKDGRGNKQFDVGKDDWGRTAYAADLTTGMLHGGRRPLDIYRRICSGINATPMPSFKEPDSTKNETPEQRSETIWHMVHFVMSIVEGRELPMDVIEETIKTLPKPGDATAAPASDEKPADAKPADEKPSDEKPSDPKPTDEKPAEDKPASEKPADKPAEEKKPEEAKPEDKREDKKPEASKDEPAKSDTAKSDAKADEKPGEKPN